MYSLAMLHKRQGSLVVSGRGTMPVGHGHVWLVGGALYQWARVTCGQLEGHCASGSGSHVLSERGTVPVGQCHVVSGRGTVPVG